METRPFHSAVILILVFSLTSTAPESQDNVIILKHVRARLDPNWIIMNHVPNGEYASLVSAILADEHGRPKDDKSMILFGVCDVSGHDGLTVFQSLTRRHEKKNERNAGKWVINYAVEAKDDGYALLVDALQYSEEHKCYLWVRRGRRIEQVKYTLKDSDVKDILAFTARVDLRGAGRQTDRDKDD